MSFVFPECNSVGTAMMHGKSLDEAMAFVQRGTLETVIVLEK